MNLPRHDDRETAQLLQTLLRSLDADVAPARGKRATLAALGLGAATSAKAGSAAAGLHAAAKMGALALVKAAAGGAIAGAVVVVGGSILAPNRAAIRRAEPEAITTPAAAVPAPVTATAAAPSAADRGGRDPIAAPSAEASPSKAASPPRRGAVSSGASGISAQRATADTMTSAAAPDPAARGVAAGGRFDAPPRASSLAREIALLDASRAALRKGDSAEALRALERYAAEFERGALEPEAAVLRIEAMVQRGDAPAARALAERFESLHPRDSHLARIRSLLADLGR